MAYDIELAQRVRAYLGGVSGITVHEKKMFGGLAFLVNGKMCINVTDDSLMCRFSPDQTDAVILRKGCQPMVMKGKNLAGYCYVNPEGFADPDDFNYWIALCLAFNEEAQVSKPKRK